jgi:hypothetical protein
MAAQASKAAEKVPRPLVIPSEARNLLSRGSRKKQIPRFARNDKINYLFRTLFKLLVSLSQQNKIRRRRACVTKLNF